MTVGKVDFQISNSDANIPASPQTANTNVETLAQKVANSTLSNVEKITQHHIDNIDKSQMENLVDNLNDIMNSFNVQAKFSVHEVTKDIMIKLVDSSNGQTIREIPSKKMVDIVAKILQLAGLLVDEKA